MKTKLMFLFDVPQAKDKIFLLPECKLLPDFLILGRIHPTYAP